MRISLALLSPEERRAHIRERKAAHYKRQCQDPVFKAARAAYSRGYRKQKGLTPEERKAKAVWQLAYHHRKMVDPDYRQTRNLRNRQWRLNNPRMAKDTAARAVRKRKLAVLEAYGGMCVCCGETTPEFLSIDHVNGDGKEHRKALGVHGAGGSIYNDLKRRGYPREGFRLLCMNCNFAFGHFGTCPHSKLSHVA